LPAFVDDPRHRAAVPPAERDGLCDCQEEDEEARHVPTLSRPDAQRRHNDGVVVRTLPLLPSFLLLLLLSLDNDDDPAYVPSSPLQSTGVGWLVVRCCPPSDFVVIAKKRFL
jgi:hypothetical protein